ncbi:MAG: presenilin family intramembrane aspartyl protease [Nanoarchaeota archaeon]
MKHNLKVTLLLLGMFFITQLIGIAVINQYSPVTKIVFNETANEYINVSVSPQLPYGMQPPETTPTESLVSIISAFVFAVILLLFLMTLKVRWFLRIWFFLVVAVAIGITFYSFIKGFQYAQIISLAFALPLAYFKVFKRSMLIHNISELLVYPGIAAIFVPILSVWNIIILLFLISAYDIYAVWHAGFMQKMAKFQIQELKVFSGFFVPYLTKEQKLLIEKAKAMKNKSQKSLKNMKISIALLGGGDVVFPLITAGVMLRSFGFVPALFVAVFATISLFVLFVLAKKGKFYPAMPYLTAGTLAGMALGYLIYMI